MKLLNAALVFHALIAPAVDAGEYFRKRYVSMCLKTRNGKYIQRTILRRLILAAQRAGGGFVGDPVPGYDEGYVFGDDCQPYRETPPPPVEYDCDQCPCGYYDGCNFCYCGSPPQSGFGSCTEKYCETLFEPRCDPCPVCDDDTFTCPDGTILSRDQYTDCEFPACPTPPPPPKCCDFEDQPDCFEGTACCPDGTWSCSIDGMSFQCGGEIITTGFGEPCDDIPPPPPKCCDFEDQPDCSEGTACCPDGTWSCSIDGISFQCGGDIITTGFGEPCNDIPSPPPRCCNPFDEPGQFGNDFCFEGHACCPDGTWACGSIGDGQTFSCGGELISSGFGRACGLDCETCPGGFYDGCNTCGCDGDREFPICTLRACGPDEFEPKRCNQDGPDTIACTQEISECPDGSAVGRDPNKNCEFFPCPTPDTFCTQDVQECPDGPFVGRDPSNDCEFFPCPESCCDPDDRPGADGGPICTDGAVCCEDCCKWTCGIGDGTFPCDGACGNEGAEVVEEINCDTCGCGYNDGCNDCKCFPDGSAACTRRYCAWEGTPSCHECEPPPY